MTTTIALAWILVISYGGNGFGGWSVSSPLTEEECIQWRDAEMDSQHFGQRPGWAPEIAWAKCFPEP